MSATPVSAVMSNTHVGKVLARIDLRIFCCAQAISRCTTALICGGVDLRSETALNLEPQLAFTVRFNADEDSTY
jgi:hypothetical protein